MTNNNNNTTTTTTNSINNINSITITRANNNTTNATGSISNVSRFQLLANELSDLYRVKNNAYGDSFSTSVRSYGLIAALTRISDKFHRLENLILHPNVDVGDERLVDTLNDLASYAIMTIMEVKNKE